MNVTVLPVVGLSGERHVSAKEMWDTTSKIVANTFIFQRCSLGVSSYQGSLDLFSYVALLCFSIKLMFFCIFSSIFDIIPQDGHFSRENINARSSMPSCSGETLCVAVTTSTWVEPHGRCTVAFALAWSSPKVKFRKAAHTTC